MTVCYSSASERNFGHRKIFFSENVLQPHRRYGDVLSNVPNQIPRSCFSIPNTCRTESRNKIDFPLKSNKSGLYSQNKEGKMILSPSIKYSMTFWVILIYPPEEFGKGNNFIDLFFQE